MGFFAGSVDLTSPGPIGSTTPNTGAFTTLSANNTFSATGQVRLSSGTGNVSLRRGDGVTFLTANYNTFFQVQAPEFRIGHDGTGGPVSFFLGGNGIIEQRNTTNAQTFRLYNTYTDASNYERGFFRWSSNILELGAEAAGTGTQRQLRFPLGTVTASTPLSITQTWNSSGVTFTGIQANITDTASASGSLLMDLQVGGSSKFSVTKAGALIINGNTATYDSGIFRVVNIRTDGNIRSDGAFQFGTTLELRADASDILAQRRSTNAQTFRLYRTFTDASNYERLGLLATNTTRYTITSQNAGTGSARSLEVSYYTSASDPTSTEITDGCFSVWKNSGTGTIKLWANDGGTMKSVALA